MININARYIMYVCMYVCMDVCIYAVITVITVITVIMQLLLFKVLLRRRSRDGHAMLCTCHSTCYLLTDACAVSDEMIGGHSTYVRTSSGQIRTVAPC